jgi:hypothetical protein
VVPLLFALAAGCTVKTGDDTVSNHCTEDASVSCPSPALGYSCSGDATPTDADASLVCGNGEENAGLTTYCCNPPAPANTCVTDPSIMSCGSTATPYTCSGNVTPATTDPSLTCGPGVSGTGGTLSYCCSVVANTTSDCNVDTTLQSCGDVSTGYRCTNGVLPTDTNARLVCGQGVDGGDGTEAFCCIDFGGTTCGADPDVVGCTGDSYGFSCTSTATPATEDPSLVCSDPIVSGGKSLYCCSQ